jgi:hypothetical protein
MSHEAIGKLGKAPNEANRPAPAPNEAIGKMGKAPNEAIGKLSKAPNEAIGKMGKAPNEAIGKMGKALNEARSRRGTGDLGATGESCKTRASGVELTNQVRYGFP